ncbi:unnamed protein product [Closterium sp. Naga37s-1]|nr:unnamed protein product [Closterium sp. Naga37s-1]
MSTSVGQPAASSNNNGQGDQPSLLLSVHPGEEKAPEYPERVAMDEDEPSERKRLSGEEVPGGMEGEDDGSVYSTIKSGLRKIWRNLGGYETLAHTESYAKERAAGARTNVKAPTIVGRVREEVEAVADAVQGGVKS